MAGKECGRKRKQLERAWHPEKEKKKIINGKLD